MTEAIDDCTEAINLDGSYLKAYLKRAKWYVEILFCCRNISLTIFSMICFIFFNSYMETEKYEEAVRDYEKVCKMNGCRGASIYF